MYVLNRSQFPKCLVKSLLKSQNGDPALDPQSSSFNYLAKSNQVWESGQSLAAVVYTIWRGGRAELLVGQQVVESTPSLLAGRGHGGKNAYSWRGTGGTLKAAGFPLKRRYLAHMPYHIAVWSFH